MSLAREEYLVTFNLFSRSAEEERDHGSLRAALIDHDAALRQRIAELEQALRLHLAVSPDDPILLTPIERQLAEADNTMADAWVSMGEKVKRIEALKAERDQLEQRLATVIAVSQQYVDELATARREVWEEVATRMQVLLDEGQHAVTVKTMLDWCREQAQKEQP